MDEDPFEMFDEFGNYIGPGEGAGQGAADENGESIDEEEEKELLREQEQRVEEEQIVLYEDKKYYPEMEEVYRGVEVLIEEEDAQAITDPLIRHIKVKKFDLRVPLPTTVYSPQFLTDMLGNPHSMRNVAIVGHLHHGKTQMVDILISQTHETKMPKSFTDARYDEIERKISVKATPITLVMPDSRGKNYLLNLIDTPGHSNFMDEVCCGLRLSDGAVLVVDCIEGCMLGTEKLIQFIVHEQLPLCVVINKLDRLIVELKIPPSDAYLKLKHTVEELNGMLREATSHLPFERKESYHLSPLKGNVLFASNDCDFIFSLDSFSRQYCQVYPNMLPETFKKVLWGDFYFNREHKKFAKEPIKGSNKRAFVEFILEPLYKIIANTVSHEKEGLSPILNQLGVYLKAEDYKLNTRELLRRVCSTFFGPSKCFVDMLSSFIPSPVEAARYHVSKYYSGNKETKIFKQMLELDSRGPCVIEIIKMYNKKDCTSFDCLGRVICGRLTKNTQIRVLGEKFSLLDEEDSSVKTVTALSILCARYSVPIHEALPGMWVLIEGVDQTISKSATLVSISYDEQIEIFRPLKFDSPAICKLAIEPLVPSDLPKMLEGLRRVSKSYPLLTTKIEESGEHLIIGSGELYLDSVMHDLRLMYGEVEIKVSDPCVTFCETIIDTSSIKCTSQTPNKMNKMTFIAEPLDKKLDVDIELEHIDLTQPLDKISKFFQNQYKWDILSSQSVWAFGPDTFGPNILIDDTLPGETDKASLNDLRDAIVQGFQWGCREGPLCEEPIRSVKFKILDASFSNNPSDCIPGQIIPTSRRTCYSSFLMANPRIMEPQLLSEIQCTGDCLPAVYNVLNRRRGHLIKESAKPGSPLFTVRASIPALDSFGFETDLRCHTVGQAFSLSYFDSWTLLPGDPLDKSIQLKILEPSPPSHLAREVLVKMRKRKGLNHDLSILNYFDDPNIIELLKRDDDYKKVV